MPSTASTTELTKSQRILLERIEDPSRRVHWAPRARRRRAVVALAAMSLVSIALFVLVLLVPAPGSFFLLAGFVAAGLLTMPLSGRVSVASRCTPKQLGLDEFQRAEMDHASLLGHRVTNAALLALLAVTSGIGGALASEDFSASVVLAVLLPMVFATTMCHAAFPACYLAWTRPDEVLDDEDEPAQA